MSFVITVCQHSASLLVTNGDPQDGFFYIILTLMIDSYSISAVNSQIPLQDAQHAITFNHNPVYMSIP